MQLAPSVVMHIFILPLTVILRMLWIMQQEFSQYTNIYLLYLSDSRI